MTTVLDLEQGHRRSSVSSCGTGDEDDETLCSFYSTNGDSFDDYRFVCSGMGESGRSSSASDCSVKVAPMRFHMEKEERECRICKQSLNSTSNELGPAIELGCSCKHDLGVAHTYCAESWLKTKGNRICEVCKIVAKNVVGARESTIEIRDEQPERPIVHDSDLSLISVQIEPAPNPPDFRRDDNRNAYPSARESPPRSLHSPEPKRFWNGHRLLNILLACMVFTFIVSLLFHFKLPS